MILSRPPQKGVRLRPTACPLCDLLLCVYNAHKTFKIYHWKINWSFFQNLDIWYQIYDLKCKIPFNKKHPSMLEVGASLKGTAYLTTTTEKSLRPEGREADSWGIGLVQNPQVPWATGLSAHPGVLSLMVFSRKEIKPWPHTRYGTETFTYS